MKEQSRIRFNPATKEIEIEGSESFVKTYFDKIQALISGTPEKASLPPKGESKSKKTAPQKKVEKKSQAKKVSPLKTVKKTNKKETDEKKATNRDKFVTLIQASKEGISTAELQEKTGLSKNHIWNIISRLTKEGQIKKIKMGLYGAT